MQNVLDGIAQDKNVNKLDSFLKKLHMQQEFYLQIVINVSELI